MKLITQIRKFLNTAINEGLPPLVVIFGPTASGKTALSVELAKALNGEIVSADSRQIYRKMPIATALVTKEEMQGIPHHMIEITDPDLPLSMAEYREMAQNCIEEILNRGKIPFLVGGTGLYISAIIENYEMAEVKPNTKLRTKLEKLAEIEGKEAVYNILKNLDPIKAEEIHTNNLRYVIRAIEISKSKTKQIPAKGKPKFATFIINLEWPREVLYNRINQRVDIMVKEGLIEEIRSLLKHGYDKSLPAITSVGVKEIIPYIEGKTTLEEAVELLKKNTRNYAKRQITWSKRYKNALNICPLKEKNGS
ncbi:MAG: tRNA (adenosine(37)-N6)-dimethylallyltransferase MiaA [Candidatus Gracilibacteria bacterium]|jgi:tRNA dimethylallyltransferase|nr:tRNA (adenosine(37)-N6)-dimethylallyltransferase MiaA [Candidatus Gracilibacteria bacterium]